MSGCGVHTKVPNELTRSGSLYRHPSPSTFEDLSTGGGPLPGGTSPGGFGFVERMQGGAVAGTSLNL